MILGRDGIKRPPQDPAAFKRLVPQVSGLADIHFEFVMDKDSTNMTPTDWTTIAKRIFDLGQNGDYDGFVIVHGVDTLAFTASAVAFALGRNLNFPVVFTGGQTMVSKVYGDGQINLIRGCKVATEDKAEVMVSFNNRVYRGCRIQKKDDIDFDGIESPAYPPLAEIKDEIEWHTKYVRPKAEYNVRKIELLSKFTSGILPVPLSPSVYPALLEPVINRGNCKGLILQSYGGANVPNLENIGGTFANLIRKAMVKEIPVVVSSHFPTKVTEYTMYQPGIDAVDAGAIPVSGIVLPALVAKLSWILPQVEAIKGWQKRKDKIKSLLTDNIIGEIGELDVPIQEKASS